jgi:uncharacterized OsmC-like protein
MREKPAHFRIKIEGKRNPSPPQYYAVVAISLNIAGSKDTKKLEQAIAFLRDRYCFLYKSLRSDILFDIRYIFEE